MLNKEEKRWINTYLIPKIKNILNICDKPTEIYKTEEMYDSESHGKNGLWFAFSDITSDIYEIEKILDNIVKGKFMNTSTFEQKIKLRDNKRKKEKELKEKIQKETINKEKPKIKERSKKLIRSMKNKHKNDLIKQKPDKITVLDKKIIAGNVQRKLIEYKDINGLTDDEAWKRIREDFEAD